MGYDCGFDMKPRLTETEVDKELWARFLHVVRNIWKDDPVVVTRPGFIEFQVGEHPSLPLEGHKFLRFSSKVSSPRLSLAEPYIRHTYLAAKLLFGIRVQFWHELYENYGIYTWKEVNDAINSYGIVSVDGLHALDLDWNGPGQVQDVLPLSLTPPGASSAEVLAAGNDNAAPQLFRIQPIAGKGLGFVACQDMKRGTRIISEKPLLKVFSGTTERKIALEVRSLSKDDQRSLLSLSNNSPVSKGPFEGLVLTNSLPLGAGPLLGGIFPLMSRINHGCLPNAEYTWSSERGEATIHAIKDILQGEEITIMYTNGPSKKRWRFLKTFFGFECSCAVCSLPAPDLAISDERLEEIGHLRSSMEVWSTIASNPAASLANARKLYNLLKAESITDERVASVLLYAFEIMIAHGDMARAKVFAERSYEERRICEGEDSPAVQIVKTFVANPAGHILFLAASNDWKQPVNRRPSDLSTEEFEKWLWTRRRRRR